MSAAPKIRREAPADAESVRRVNEAAFGQPGEARLVARLRAAGAALESWVAELDGQVVGHVLFSPVQIVRAAGTTLAVGLAPVAVLPAYQGRGVGALLIRRGLDELRAAGFGGVVLLGHPDYYPRFGFVPADRFELRFEYDAPREACQALELRPGGFGRGPGLVRYRPEFSEVASEARSERSERRREDGLGPSGPRQAQPTPPAVVQGKIKLRRNDWIPERGLTSARILDPEDGPEGIAVDRTCFTAARLVPGEEQARIVSVLAGRLRLTDSGERLEIGPRVHLYLPPGTGVEAEAGSEIVRVASARARGQAVLVRDERYLSAAASEALSLRWILTPQYLSRRIFLHHDPVLLSAAGDPVSWFHTTMFDVAGLPPNEEGEPVFKMSYNSRTELNVCYAVEGQARVRMALHPYRSAGQEWSPWLPLDGESTYLLNEAAGGPEEERRQEGGLLRTWRNKHEVSCLGGQVSLFCLFDPAPTGVERHRPGEYSDYEPLAEVAARPEYQAQRRVMEQYDRMVDRLSRARAAGRIDSMAGGADWALYQAGRARQQALEEALCRAMPARGERLARWRLPGDGGIV